MSSRKKVMSLFNLKKDKLPAGVTLERSDAGLVVHLARSISADFLLDDAEGLKNYRFILEEGARTEVLAFACGDTQTLAAVEADMLGKDSYFSFKGLSVLDDTQNQRLKVTARHKAPHTTSRQLFKSVLSETAFSDFETAVSVERGAPRADSNQLCRNLLLSEGARAVSRPLLNIDNDDVSCTHGATTGPMEESELFYLRSRGLTESAAKELLVYGFAEEILEAVQDAEVRSRLESLVRAKLQKALKKR